MLITSKTSVHDSYYELWLAMGVNNSSSSYSTIINFLVATLLQSYQGLNIFQLDYEMLGSGISFLCMVLPQLVDE